MIKINLIKNRNQDSTGSTQVRAGDFEFETMSVGSESEGPQSGVVKLVLIGIWILGLIAYESYNIGELNAERDKINQDNQALLSEIERNQPIAERAKQLQTEINELRQRIEKIKELSRVRLREIKIVDYIQNNIPDKVWLLGLEVRDNRLLIRGTSLADDELNKFLEVLNGRSYFRNVILMKAVDQKSKQGNMKMFEIASDLVSSE